MGKCLNIKMIKYDVWTDELGYKSLTTEWRAFPKFILTIYTNSKDIANGNCFRKDLLNLLKTLSIGPPFQWE